MPNAALELRKRDANLPLILALLVAIRDLGRLASLEEQDLRDPFVRVDLRWQRRRVRDLQRDEAFPLRLERRDVRDDPASRVRGLAHGYRHDVTWNTEVFDRAGEREGVRWDDADVALELDERLRIEALGIDDGVEHVREDPELAGDPHVIAVGADAI